MNRVRNAFDAASPEGNHLIAISRSLDHALEPRVQRQVQHAHATAAQLGDDAVGTDRPRQCHGDGRRRPGRERGVIRRWGVMAATAEATSWAE